MPNTRFPPRGTVPTLAKRKPPQHVFPPYPACQPMSLEAPCLLSACGDEKPEVRETLLPLQLSCSRDPLLIPCPKKGQQPAHAIGAPTRDLSSRHPILGATPQWAGGAGPSDPGQSAPVPASSEYTRPVHGQSWKASYPRSSSGPCTDHCPGPARENPMGKVSGGGRAVTPAQKGLAT